MTDIPDDAPLNSFGGANKNKAPHFDIESSPNDISQGQLEMDVAIFLAKGGSIKKDKDGLEFGVPSHKSREWIRANRDELMKPLKKPFDITSKGYTR